MEKSGLPNLTVSYVCNRADCMFHKMPRYTVRIDGRTDNKLSEWIIMDNFYIEIDFLQKKTTIAKLNIVLLTDHIHIAHALHLDLKNYPAALDKVKLLVMFS